MPVLGVVGLLGVGVSSLAAAASLVARFARSRGDTRAQLKWLAAAASLVAVSLLASFVSPHKYQQALLIAAMTAVPAAIGIAILRYRLYEIDVLINRTLVYASLTAVLGLFYVASIALLQLALARFTAGSDVAVAGSTLVVVAAFQPVRRRIERAVDRRFYRAKYDAARTLDRLATRLRNEVDLDEVRADLLTAVNDTVHPAHASLWLRNKG